MIETWLKVAGVSGCESKSSRPARQLYRHASRNRGVTLTRQVWRGLEASTSHRTTTVSYGRSCIYVIPVSDLPDMQVQARPSIDLAPARDELGSAYDSLEYPLFSAPRPTRRLSDKAHVVPREG